MIIEYNIEGNTKNKHGYLPIVKTLVKACNGRVKEWPWLLSYGLWANQTIHSSMIGYIPLELIIGQKFIMSIEEHMPTWNILCWEYGLIRKLFLLVVRIQQLQKRSKDVDLSLKRLQKAKLKNKIQFDKQHQLKLRSIEKGD